MLQKMTSSVVITNFFAQKFGNLDKIHSHKTTPTGDFLHLTLRGGK